MSDEMNMLALVKGEEKYIFLFDEKNRSETLRQLGKYASDPELSFTWYDAAVLSQKSARRLKFRLIRVLTRMPFLKLPILATPTIFSLKPCTRAMLATGLFHRSPMRVNAVLSEI